MGIDLSEREHLQKVWEEIMNDQPTHDKTTIEAALDQLCQECDVSRETARRVLANLERRGLIEVRRVIQWEDQTNDE